MKKSQGNLPCDFFIQSDKISFPKRFGENMTITIRDVAKALNLSITTVSRALDGYDDVAKETRELVISTAHQMGYTPNRAARQLRRQRSETIGYILPTEKPQFADAFYSEFIAGLGDMAALSKFDLLVSAASPDSAEERALYERWVQGRKVDGIVLNRTRLQDWRIQFLSAQKIPFVALERSLLPVEFIGVEADSYQGFLDLMAYLTGRGHNRIAYIGAPPELKIEYDRHNGYQAGLKAASIEPDPALIVHADLTPEGGYQVAGHLLNQSPQPTAIVCVNDLTAIGAMHAAHERGLKVGRDIAIAGFDGIADSAHTQPPLTTLDQPVYAIARQLVTMLLALINGEPLVERQVKIEPKLLIRESTGK
jgi:DNA-binding LacI/PurR family transcriptional regulator